ncbi:MAG: FAD-dependent oxidoreductase [Gammaproteobacteria bacterium]|nr:FAD-dependent oxidoreductase [Gammaproteobacteria bacterium]
MHQLVIIGGGFAGLWAALTAAREANNHAADVRITVVARDKYLTVRPRLYEVFTDAMRAPLNPVLTPLGIQLKVGVATTLDTKAKSVEVRGEEGNVTLPYDRLVLAAGSEQRPLEIPGAAEFSLNIDTFGGARSFDRHLREVLRSPAQPGRSTFVIVGAGFTGIELATEMRNRIRLHSDADTARAARVILVERENVVGPDLGTNPRPHIEAALRDANVETYLGARLAKIERDAVTLASGERIATATVVVTAGLKAHPIAGQLRVELDRQGRVMVDPMLRVNGVPTAFAAGDIAHAHTDDDHVALMSCQHAIPMGKFAGYNAAHDLLGLPLRAYSQPNYVTCLDLGESGALFTQGWDRKPEQFGLEVKSLKRMVNTQWIYPPTGNRDAILTAADLDAPWPPAV